MQQGDVLSLETVWVNLRVVDAVQSDNLVSDKVRAVWSVWARYEGVQQRSPVLDVGGNGEGRLEVLHR